MRVFNDMTDIVLDAPNAYHTLSKIVERGFSAGFVSRVISEELPSRYVCVVRVGSIFRLIDLLLCCPLQGSQTLCE